MAGVHGKGTRILLDGVDLTRFFRQVDTGENLDTPESTTFLAENKTYVAGLPQLTVNCQGIFNGDPDSVDEQLHGILGSITDSLLTVGFNGLGAGARVLTARVIEAAYEIHSPVADIVSIVANFMSDGPESTGTSLAPLGPVAGTGTGGAQDNGSPTGPLPITAAAWAAGTATVTTGTIPHGMLVGQQVTVAGVDPSGYNVANAVITAVTSTTISYAVAADPGAYVSGGTVQ